MNPSTALENMVWQFGYRGIKDGHPVIHTGGLSALEEAFDALGWDDPHIIPEEGSTCEVAGCMNPISFQGSGGWGSEYLLLCLEHSAFQRKGAERPPIKQYALDREATRDPITRQLPLSPQPSNETKLR